MRINRIILQNWKNFSNADVTLTKRSFLVGPNAAGKSNFLDALRFLNDIVKEGGGLGRAIAERGGLKKIRSLSARRVTNVEIQLELIDQNDRWLYHLGLKQEGGGLHRTLVARELVRKNDDILLDRPNAEETKDVLRLTQTNLEQVNANILFRDLYSFFLDINYIHLIPQIIRQPELFFNTSVKLDEDSFGFHFIERILSTPKNTRSSRLKKIEQALRIAVPNLTELTDMQDDKGVPHLEAIYRHWRPNAGKQQEKQFSDGTIRLIGLLWSVLENKSLLLLEEPELSLHPAIVKNIPLIINNLSKKDTQILLSTHSPDLLSDASISAQELILLTPFEEGTRIKVAADIDEVRCLMESGFNADEAVIPYITPKEFKKLSELS